MQLSPLFNLFQMLTRLMDKRPRVGFILHRSIVEYEFSFRRLNTQKCFIDIQNEENTET